MRQLLSAIAMFFAIFCLATPGWSQSSDRFGGDPFASPPLGNETKTKAAPRGQSETLKQAQLLLVQGRKPIKPAAANSSVSQQRLHAALNYKTTQTFVETPLVEAIAILSQSHDIPIVIDRRALEEVGIDANIGVNLDLRDVSLRSFLRLMLHDFDLTYMVTDEVMIITTVEAAEKNLVLEMYSMPEPMASKTDQLIKVLTATVVPDTWDIAGGPSSAVAFDHVLVISTTSDVHQRCKAFLEMLIEKYGKQDG